MPYLDPEQARRYARLHSRRRIRAHQAFLDEIKLERGCIDCGYRENAAALEFDHRDPDTKLVAPSGKRMTVSGMGTWPRDKVLAEIEKCDVRCANCHAIRTGEEGHWNRSLEERNGQESLL